MPAGELLIKEVAKVLSVLDAKTVVQVHGELEEPVSKRAVRYALADLVKRGSAKRIGRPGQHFRVMAVCAAESLREKVKRSNPLGDAYQDLINAGVIGSKNCK